MHLTGAFAATSGVVDYPTLKATFDGWYWQTGWRYTQEMEGRVAEYEKVVALTPERNYSDFLTLLWMMLRPLLR